MLRMSARPSTNSSRPNTANRGRSRPGDRLLPTPDVEGPFQFAKIPYLEIQEDLTGMLNRKVALEELKVPAFEVVNEVLTSFISEVLDKKPEDLTQPVFGVVDQVEYSELYEDAVFPQIIFFRYAQQVLEISCFNQFGLRDLFSPSKTRFHFQLSALVNFTRFRVHRLAAFEDLEIQAEAEMEQARGLREVKGKLEQSISEIESERERDRPQLEEVQNQIKDKGYKLGSQHKQQTRLSEQTQEKKQELAKLNEESKQLKETIAAEREIVDRMQAKVVASPARVKAELDGMSEKLESENEYVESVHHRNRMLALREESLSELCTTAENLVAVNKDSVDKVQGRLHALANISRMKVKKVEITAQNQAYEEMKMQLKKQSSSMEGRIARIDEQHKEMMSGRTEEDVKLAEDLKAFNLANERINREKTETRALADELQQEILDILKEELEEATKCLETQKQTHTRMIEFQKDVTDVFTIFAETTDSSKQKFDRLVSSWN